MKPLLGQSCPDFLVADGPWIAHCPEVYVDSGKQASLKQVQQMYVQQGFRPLDSLVFGPKYQRGRHAYWLYLQIANPTADRLEVDVSCGLFEQVEVYQDGKLVARMGMRLSQAENPHPVFPNRVATRLFLPPSQTTVYWIRVANAVEINRPLQPALFVAEEVLAQEVHELTWFYVSLACFFILLLFLGLINLLQFVQNRDQAYLYYALYLISLLLFYSRDFDMNSPILHLWPLGFQDQGFLVPIVSLSAVMYMLFLDHFLDAKDKIPGLHRLNRTWMWASIGFLLVEQIIRRFDPWLAWAAYGFFKLGALLLIIAVLAYLVRIRNRTPLTFYVLSGTLILVISSLATALMSFMPVHLYKWWDITYFPQYGGILLEVIFFSLGLAYKSRLAEMEKTQATTALQIKEAESRQLQELNQRKTDFFTNISHDFRTPLTIIQGITRRLQASDTLSLQEGLQRIQQSSQGLLALVNQLLDISKLDQGQLQATWVQVDLVNLLGSCVDEHRLLAQDKGIILEFLREKAELFADTDPALLKAIIGNLLSNALKFTRENGKVSLTLSQPDVGSLRIEVADTGSGIPQDVQDKIFDRYVHGDNSTGYGLGLSIVKDLSALINADLDMNSTVGVGTTFSLHFSLTQEAPMLQLDSYSPTDIAHASHSLASHPADPSARILLVEDNAGMRSYLQSLLGIHFFLRQASNIKEASALVKEESFDLVISDVMMEKRDDGFVFCQELKQNKETAHLPVILITARAEQASRLSGLTHGADAYLSKPFDEAELFTRIEQLLLLRERMLAHFQKNAVQALIGDVSLVDQDKQLIQALNETCLDRLDDRSFGVIDMARTVGKSKSAFHDWLRTCTGITPAKYLLQLRLSLAHEFIIGSRETIEVIAERTGFTDGTHLTKKYKAAYQYTPSQVRKMDRA